MVDYSKWDRMAIDMDDDDESEPRKPRVTKFDKPKSITFNNTGITAIGESKYGDVVGQHERKWTENGGQTSNSIFWSQTRRDVVIVGRIPSGTRSNQVQVILEDLDDHCQRLDVKISNIVIFGGQLRYPIERDSVMDCGVDWNMEDDPTRPGRIIKLSLVKKLLLGNDVSIFWKNVFVGDDEIDVLSIQGRDRSSILETQRIWEEAQSNFVKNV